MGQCFKEGISGVRPMNKHAISNRGHNVGYCVSGLDRIWKSGGFITMQILPSFITMQILPSYTPPVRYFRGGIKARA
jgi:hypothetical protein